MNENENYIMLNGKKIPLTDEQIKLIQADEPKKSPFDRVRCGDKYYYFGCGFDVHSDTDHDFYCDTASYNAANYCTDENIMKQHALHMKLTNLLWRYSMTHGGDKINWHDDIEIKYAIFYEAVTGEFGCSQCPLLKYFGDVIFASEETVKAAIKEIVEPFVAEHPDFDLTKM